MRFSCELFSSFRHHDGGWRDADMRGNAWEHLSKSHVWEFLSILGYVFSVLEVTVLRVG